MNLLLWYFIPHIYSFFAFIVYSLKFFISSAIHLPLFSSKNDQMKFIYFWFFNRILWSLSVALVNHFKPNYPWVFLRSAQSYSLLINASNSSSWMRSRNNFVSFPLPMWVKIFFCDYDSRDQVSFPQRYIINQMAQSRKQQIRKAFS